MTAATRPWRVSLAVTVVREFPITLVAEARLLAELVSALKGKPKVENMAMRRRNRKKQGTPPLPLLGAAGSAGLNACATTLPPKSTIKAGHKVRMAEASPHARRC